jgi:hypothetical protein
MSGSPGNTGAGAQGGRTPRNQNADLVDRHGRPGGRHTGGTDASTDARATQTGERDAKRADPDRPDQSEDDDSSDGSSR